MISKIEIRQFAVEQAVAIMGAGTPQKDVVAKAAEIEAYVVGDADIPEVSSDTDTINDIMGNAMQMINGISGVEIHVEEKSKKSK